MDFHQCVYLSDSSVTGLRWKVRTGRRCVIGAVAGHSAPSNQGRCTIGILGRNYKVHRIVALLAGIIDDINSAMLIDHIDGNPNNNQPSNLRAVNPRDNCLNKQRHREGKLAGCYFNKTEGKWHAQIRVADVQRSLGYFSSEVAANAAYLKALESL